MNGIFRYRRPSADYLKQLNETKARGIILKGPQPGLNFKNATKTNPLFGSVIGVERISHNRWWLYKNGNFKTQTVGARTIWFKKT